MGRRRFDEGALADARLAHGWYSAMGSTPGPMRINSCCESLPHAARGGVLRNTIVCQSTVSRGHFRTGTHSHLRLSHFLHDLDTFVRVRGRAAGTRWH